jgi:DNA polymerase-3 subunit delta'
MAEALEVALSPWLEPEFARLEQARSRGKLAHAWLIAGPRGIGKLNLALAFAHRLLNPESPHPAGLDAAAAAAAIGELREPKDHHPDLHKIFPEADKRQIGIERIREAIGALELTSLRGGAKALVIEPAEGMTLAAANALLKTLEEPTPSTYFFLVSHQPGRLPGTIRSRCQLLSIARPSADESLRWLTARRSETGREELERLLALAGGAPWRAVELSGQDYININKELEDMFNQISNYKLDPQSVADRWLKGNLELLLGWLELRLQWAIKGRMAPEAWTPVTDLGADALHNAWAGLTLAALFDGLRRTQTLLAQLGRGINVDLAVRVLLLGFQPEREPT